ncbi:hypothetical protein CAP35_13855 [Chitinophagaceae bacterium IBVUCB1]|nr:hypothetical protein CAP35_13855 [Chitinophagaceae bacterium IBVUCB1]
MTTKTPTVVQVHLDWNAKFGRTDYTAHRRFYTDSGTPGWQSAWTSSMLDALDFVDVPAEEAAAILKLLEEKKITSGTWRIRATADKAEIIC